MGKHTRTELESWGTSELINEILRLETTKNQ